MAHQGYEADARHWTGKVSKESRMMLLEKGEEKLKEEKLKEEKLKEEKLKEEKLKEEKLKEEKLKEVVNEGR